MDEFDQMDVPQFDAPGGFPGGDLPLDPGGDMVDPFPVEQPVEDPADAVQEPVVEPVAEEPVEEPVAEAPAPGELPDAVVPQDPSPVVEVPEEALTQDELVDLARELGAGDEVLAAIAAAGPEELASIEEALSYDPHARATFFMMVLEIPQEQALFGLDPVEPVVEPVEPVVEPVDAVVQPIVEPVEASPVADPTISRVPPAAVPGPSAGSGTDDAAVEQASAPPTGEHRPPSFAARADAGAPASPAGETPGAPPAGLEPPAMEDLPLPEMPPAPGDAAPGEQLPEGITLPEGLTPPAIDGDVPTDTDGEQAAEDGDRGSDSGSDAATRVVQAAAAAGVAGAAATAAARRRRNNDPAES